MKKYVAHSLSYPKQTAAFALGLLIIGVAIGAALHKETVVVREGTADTPAAMSSVNLMIDYGNGTIKTWNTVTWHEAMSVYGLLETVAAANAITIVEGNLGGKNRTVLAIDGVANGAEPGARWQYWINNTYEPRIASQYFIRPGDIILWKYVKEQPR